MAFAKAFGGARGAARAMVLIACGGGLAGCDTLASINPFDRTEKYKMELSETHHAPSELASAGGCMR